MENWTELAYCDYAPQGEYIGFCVAMPIIMITMTILICGGNCLTILAVWKTPSLQTMPNMFIVSLAVADFITGISFGYDSLWYISFTEVFIYNCKFCCLVNVFLLFLSLNVSMASIIAIALDRYFYIMYPFLYNRIVTVFTFQVIIAVMWILSTALAVVPFFENSFDTMGYCAHFSILPVWYQIYIEITLFMLVFVTCLITNGAIVHLTIVKQRGMRSLNVTSDALQRYKSDWRAIRQMFAICGAFFASLLPFHIAILVNHFTQIWIFTFDILAPIAILNSCMNFFIYAFMNRHFRKAFLKMLCCCKTNVVAPNVN